MCFPFLLRLPAAILLCLRAINDFAYQNPVFAYTRTDYVETEQHWGHVGPKLNI